MKNQKGVTLIALIITIIVMLILVVVTINIATSGELVNKTIDAKTQTQAAQLNEKNEMDTAANGIDIAVMGETSTGYFTGDIVQPNNLFIPEEGQTYSEIFINPEPVNEPNDLIAEFGHGDNWATNSINAQFVDRTKNIRNLCCCFTSI